ncbi:MAG: superoxide dismutase, Ni [Dehalococcoidia bacterium]|nr:superoxide dismutase, Ni [Dehalococcoidia bacterium]
MFNAFGRVLDRVLGIETVYAHCDIPCGIYDPHGAQIAALTVLRLNQLAGNLAMPAPGDKGAMDAYGNTIARYIATKEAHAELVKHEVRIIWGDYIRPEHVDKYPDLHSSVFGIMKLGSRNKQNMDLKAAEELVAAVQKFAELFWATKGVQTRRGPSNQTVGGEIVYPA